MRSLATVLGVGALSVLLAGFFCIAASGEAQAGYGCGSGYCHSGYGYDGGYHGDGSYGDGYYGDGYYGRGRYDRDGYYGGGYYGGGYYRDGYYGDGDGYRHLVCDSDGDRCYRSYRDCWDYREYYRRHGYHWED